MLRPVEPSEGEPLAEDALRERAKELFREAREHYADALPNMAIPEIFRTESLTKYQIKRIAERAEYAALSWRKVANALDMLTTEIQRSDEHERSKYRMKVTDTGDGVHFRSEWVRKDDPAHPKGGNEK